MPRCVSAPDNRRKMIERRVLDLVDAKDGIERAAFPFVREFYAIDVVGNPTGAFGNGKDLVLRDVDELCIGIDEPAYQPGAGDTIDLWVFACHPFAGSSANIKARG